GVLAVLPHEDLAAEPDDRLVRAPVAVVLEATAVELDHPLRVLLGPEDVVVEEAVAVVRGLLGDLRASDRAVPDERRHAVERARRRGEALQRSAELALPVDDVLAPQPAQQCVVLDRERDAVADVLPEPGIDRAGVAA